MKRLRCAVAWILLVFFPLQALPVFGADTEPLAGRDPNAVITEMLQTAKDRTLNTKEMVELSFAYLMTRQFDRAELTATLALGTTHNAKQKAAIYALISQNLGLMGRYKEAGLQALEGQRLDPESKWLAAYRLEFFDKAGETLQSMAAKDHLMRLDGSGREPAVATAPFAIASGVIISAVVVIVNWLKGSSKDDTEMYKSLGVIWVSVGLVAASTP